MNLVTQFKGRVKAYKMEGNKQGVLLSFLLKNEEVVKFQCTGSKQAAQMLADVGFFE